MRSRIVPVAGLVLLLAGCGGSPTAPGGTSPAPTSGPPASSVSPTPTPPTSVPGQLTLQGKVSAGVESGCLVMESGGKQYLLVGGDPAVVKPGAEVEVRGVLKPELASFCQQGEPLEISSAKGR
ncbi:MULTISPECIES: hypothetical protein [unclassified Crossiella]|uniref:hypothetical protein n=1 Tax=unclassified Crossiella TaxID=2620835 RepID=UPI001FFF5B3E|nr:MULTISPECIES: hypothetical protein [unclassified Crossiella]MCK2239194.1 hypothetical protein [Crossiella sp. S99.2]MCK2251237.1 hypothetical protein [Crossiella sp. S99.1]